MQLITLQIEINRVNEENQRLGSMLDLLAKKYTALHSQFLQLLQQRQIQQEQVSTFSSTCIYRIFIQLNHVFVHIFC